MFLLQLKGATYPGKVLTLSQNKKVTTDVRTTATFAEEGKKGLYLKRNWKGTIK